MKIGFDNDLSSLNQAHKMRPESSKLTQKFKENFTKIWTDREGNHNIIRYGGKIFYFNIALIKLVKIHAPIPTNSHLSASGTWRLGRTKLEFVDILLFLQL